MAKDADYKPPTKSEARRAYIFDRMAGENASDIAGHVFCENMSQIENFLKTGKTLPPEPALDTGPSKVKTYLQKKGNK